MAVKDKYTIGELAEISGISTKTLRLYDAKGLLEPLERDAHNNYRYYSEQEVVKAVMIREMKHRGFTMSEQISLLKSPDLKKIKRGIKTKIKTIEKKIDTLTDQLNYTKSAYQLIGDALEVYNDETSTPSFKIDDVPEMNVLFIRKRSHVNANRLFWDRYNELQMLRQELQVTPAGPFSAIFHDHYFNQFFFDEGDLEVFLPIQESDLYHPNVRKIAPAKRASTVYVGWYAKLIASYVELVKFIEREGYRIIGPAYEEYLVEFTYGVCEDDCVTRVSFPIIGTHD